MTFVRNFRGIQKFKGEQEVDNLRNTTVVAAVLIIVVAFVLFAFRSASFSPSLIMYLESLHQPVQF